MIVPANRGPPEDLIVTLFCDRCNTIFTANGIRGMCLPCTWAVHHSDSTGQWSRSMTLAEFRCAADHVICRPRWSSQEKEHDEEATDLDAAPAGAALQPST